MFPTPDDSDLILQWQKGHDSAFEVLYKRHVVKLIALAVSKTGCRDVAEELVHDVFMNIFLKKKSAHQILNFPAFLTTMVRNKVCDHYRRELQLKKYKAQRKEQYSEADHSTVQIIETRELEAQVAIQVEKLPLKCKNVYQLSRQQYLPNKEIAALLNISENTVEQHIRKALSVLRTFLMENNKAIILSLFLNLHAWL